MWRTWAQGREDRTDWRRRQERVRACARSRAEGSTGRPCNPRLPPQATRLAGASRRPWGQVPWSPGAAGLAPSRDGANGHNGQSPHLRAGPSSAHARTSLSTYTYCASRVRATVRQDVKRKPEAWGRAERRLSALPRLLRWNKENQSTSRYWKATTGDHRWFTSALFTDVRMATRLMKLSAFSWPHSERRPGRHLSHVNGSVSRFAFNMNSDGNFGASVRACTCVRNCEILWEAHFLVHFNLVCHNSASLVMASQGGSHKPGAGKNYRVRNMSLIFWPKGQRVDCWENSQQDSYFEAKLRV